MTSSLLDMAIDESAKPDVEAFLVAWARWNDMPGEVTRVVGLQEAAEPLARLRGLTVTAFLARLFAEARRQLIASGGHVIEPRTAVYDALEFPAALR